MLQELFRIHLFGRAIPIYGYGLMLVVAFLACVKTSQWLGVRKGIRPELFVDATLIAMVSGPHRGASSAMCWKTSTTTPVRT